MPFPKIFKTSTLKRDNSQIDWVLFFTTIILLMAGLVTMHSFGNDSSYAFRQLAVILIALVVFFIVNYFFDPRLLRSTSVSVFLFMLITVLLSALFVVGKISHGARGWFDFG